MKLSFHGNPNIGLYGVCHEERCLVGERLSERDEQALSEKLHATLEHVSVAGTPMAGVFLASAKGILLVPHIAFDAEIAALRKHARVEVFETLNTCLGNNIVANEHGCLVNPDFTDEEIGRLARLLGVPVKRIEIAGTPTPGASILINGARGVIHRDAAPHEIEMVKETLKLERLEPASINLGSPYLRAGILHSNHDFVVGEASGGPEIVHIEQVLYRD